MQVDDITICTGSCWIIGGRRERVKEGNKGGWTDQTTVYSQLGHTEKPLWILTLKLQVKDSTWNMSCCSGRTCGRREGEWRRWRWGNMVDRFCMHIWNKTMKHSAVVLSGGGWGGRWWGWSNYVQCKASQNCHNESPLHNEYMLIKLF
jgi:hypothetical protein